MPALAVMSRRTGRDLPIPVEVEGFDGEGALGARLLLVVLQHRSGQGDVVITRGGHEAVGVDIGGVDEMACRQQVLRRQRRVQRVEHRPVHDRGRCRRDVDDQRWLGVVAGLGQVDLVADPCGRALLGVVHVRIVGRGDHRQGRWDALGLRPPADPPVSLRASGGWFGDVEVLQPDPAKDHHGGDVAQPARCSLGVDGCKQPEPVITDRLRAGAARRLALRDMEVVDETAVALDSARIRMGP